LRKKVRGGAKFEKHVPQGLKPKSFYWPYRHD